MYCEAKGRKQNKKTYSVGQKSCLCDCANKVVHLIVLHHSNWDAVYTALIPTKMHRSLVSRSAFTHMMRCQFCLLFKQEFYSWTYSKTQFLYKNFSYKKHFPGKDKFVFYSWKIKSGTVACQSKNTLRQWAIILCKLRQRAKSFGRHLSCDNKNKYYCGHAPDKQEVWRFEIKTPKGVSFFLRLT